MKVACERCLTEVDYFAAVICEVCGGVFRAVNVVGPTPFRCAVLGGSRSVFVGARSGCPKRPRGQKVCYV
jgi:hypothetical protein